MQTSKQHSSHEDLPEAVAQMDSSTHKYSVLTHPVHYDTQKELAYHETGLNTVTGRPKWTRWPFLLLYGILIATIAGVAGGFIGHAIVSKPQDQAPSNTTCSSPIPTPGPTSTNASAIDPLARILPIPKTGCPSTTSQQYMPSTSTNTRIQYTMVCATRWTNPHMVAISAATTSDCIEACSSFNDNAAPDKTCLGASFVPQWWNQTRAMGDKNAPFNCFLMGANDKIEKNGLGFEIVALCLGDACKDKIGF